jgi:hypothetical protein
MGENLGCLWRVRGELRGVTSSIPARPSILTNIIIVAMTDTDTTGLVGSRIEDPRTRLLNRVAACLIKEPSFY